MEQSTPPAQCTHRYNIDNIHLSPSPIHTHSRIFQPGMLFDTEIFQRIQTEVDQSSNKFMIKKEDDDDDDDDDDEQESDDDDDDDDNNNNSGKNHKLYDILDQARATEIQHLSQIIHRDRPTNTNHEIADLLLELIGHLSQTTTARSASTLVKTDETRMDDTTTITTTTHPYPPIHQTGTVTQHDRPYADYGHLDRQTLAQEFQFNLQPPPPPPHLPLLRLDRKSFAITSWTHVSKELVMNTIKDEFGIENIQYICIAEEISELNHQRHLHIQIILKAKINKKKRFLDPITQTYCNYQVTQNDRAWNEYIKKGNNYIEFGDFQSVSTRGQKQWPSSSSSPSTTTTTAAAAAATTTTTTITTRAQVEQRRQRVKQALDVAVTSVNDAMDLIRHAMPEQFLAHSTWYLATFKYVHLRAQQETDRRDDINKEYVWPLSFPDCTPQLREAVNQWIRHHFSRSKRAKCLIIIGPTGTGKTSFALSLPGRVNYFKERWNLDKWNDYARYSVYDDIPWDEFKNLNYPNKKGLLTQNGKMNATDKYRATQEINVRQPAIVLLNPEDAGSLTAQPITMQQQQNAAYWKKRAFIYIMGPDEYFYRRTTINTGNTQQQSSSSSIASNAERIGEPDEFDKMIQRYQQKHAK